MWSAGEGDSQERFLADLRALRDAAALGYDELAARAHYPSNILKEAENGPGLPGLPILAAYVRACDADVPEWEERWRRLAPDAQTDPGLPVRPAGASPAAMAGARAGITVAPPDVYDPERIRAALRGQGGSADPAVPGTGQSRAAAPGRADAGTAHADPGRADPETANAAPGRADPDTAHADPGTPDGPDTAHADPGTPDGPDIAHADPGTPDGPEAWTAGAGWADSARNGGSRQDTGSGWHTETRWDTAAPWNAPAGLDAAPANGNHHVTYATSVFDPPATDAFGPEVPSPAAREDAEPTRWSADGPLEPPVTAESEPSWQPAQTGYAVPEDMERGPGLAQGAGSGGSAVTAPVRAGATTAVAAQSRSDRLFPLRLFAVMVVAAIIGSVLVLLIR